MFLFTFVQRLDPGGVLVGDAACVLMCVCAACASDPVGVSQLLLSFLQALLPSLMISKAGAHRAGTPGQNSVLLTRVAACAIGRLFYIQNP